jgi:hypothetical protein
VADRAGAFPSVPRFSGRVRAVSLGCVRLVISMPNESRSSMAKKRRTPPALNRLENASEMFLLAATGSQQRIPFPVFLFRRQLPRRPRHPSCRHTGGWGPERHGPTYPVLPPSFVPYSSFFLWTWLESVASRSGRLGGTRNAVPATALGRSAGRGRQRYSFSESTTQLPSFDAVCLLPCHLVLLLRSASRSWSTTFLPGPRAEEGAHGTATLTRISRRAGLW